MAVISEYDEAKAPSPCQARSSTPATLDREESSKPSATPASLEQPDHARSPLSLPLDSAPFRHDHALSDLLKEHHEQPLELLTTVIEFLFRKTELSRDGGVESKVAAVVAAVKKSLNDGDHEAGAALSEKGAGVEELHRISSEPLASPKTAEPSHVAKISTSSVAQKSPEKRKIQEHVASKIASSNEVQPEDGAGLKPNLGNGFDHTKYSWTQTLGEVSLHVRLPKGTKGKEVACEIKNKTLKAGLKGQKPVLEGEFYKLVMPDACFWTLGDCGLALRIDSDDQFSEDDGTLSILLTKCNRMEWWKSVVRGEPEIDTKKVDPEISRLHDLDSETRGTVEKMMYDQRQKKLGLPTSAESGKAEVLKKFMAQHPEMDFSNANIS